MLLPNGRHHRPRGGPHRRVPASNTLSGRASGHAPALAELEEHKHCLSLGQRADARTPCALLVNHRCAAYPVRPLTCRGFNSSDAHLCELFLQSPWKVVVPACVPQLRLMTFVLDGMRAGLSESGLRGDLVELTAALRIALELPDAAERWLAGEAVFAPARLN